MRMKEVCERTGLTDRAVRLYIESGLLLPRQEENYAGRRTIIFSDADVEELERISMLRKAEFSIADIRVMQNCPERIPEILALHRQSVEESINTKRLILQSLGNIEGNAGYREIAEHLRSSSSFNKIPEEDSKLSLKDIKKIVSARTMSVFAFAFSLIGLLALLPLAVKTAFGDRVVVGKGATELVYSFSLDRVTENIPVFISLLMLVCAVILFFCSIIKGKNVFSVTGGIACLISILLLLFMPADVSFRMYAHEFWGYRYSVMWHVFRGTSGGFDVFVKSLKYLCPFAALVFSALEAVKAVGVKKQEV